MAGIAIALGIAAAPVRAATWTWDGNPSSGAKQWNNANMWNPNTVPVSDGTADLVATDVTFWPVAMGANFNIHTLTFGAAGHTLISGNTLTLSNSGAAITSTGTNEVDPAIVLAAPASFTSTSGTFTVGGTVNNGGNLLTVDGAGNVTFLSAAIVSGAGGLTKNGTGTVTLNGAQSYAGATSVTAGTLTLSGSLTNSSTINVSNGATFNANGAIPSGTNLTADGTVNFTAASPTLATLTDSGAGTRSVTIGNGLTLTHTGTSGFGGSISGQGNLAKTTGGQFTLSGTNTYTGTTSITGGTLTVNGAISGAGGAVTVSGSGKLAGSGTVARTINLNSGGTISPAGDGANTNVGALSTNGENWAGGSTYVWEIKDAAGPAGTGYDTLNVSGAVNVTATTGSKMTIRLVSHGAIANFDGIQPWNWNIATGSSNVTGFTSTDQFTLITSDFTDDNPAADPGAFKVSVSGSSVRITYLPEPTTAVIGCVGMAALLRRRRRSPYNRQKRHIEPSR
jgi:autotransporter-associated beta strand protein